MDNLSESTNSDAVTAQSGDELRARLQPLIEKCAAPNGWYWMFPLRVVPVDGKPTIRSHRGGNLFRGYIGTWDEADLLVALANAAPRILAALASTDMAGAGPAIYISKADALAVVARCTPGAAGGPFSHTNSMRCIADDIYRGIDALTAAPPVEGLTSGEGGDDNGNVDARDWDRAGVRKPDAVADGHGQLGSVAPQAHRWRLVPAEPTREMVEAVWKATLGGSLLSAERAARAMLAAAPKATATASVREAKSIADTFERAEIWTPSAEAPRMNGPAVARIIRAITDSGTAATIGGERV